MIRFVKDHETRSAPPEKYLAGAEPKGLSPESEMHFVRRGFAGFVRDGKLYDHENREIVDAPGIEVVNVSANRSAGVGRAGEVLLGDGTPPRATSAPPKRAAPRKRAAKPKRA